MIINILHILHVATIIKKRRNIIIYTYFVSLSPCLSAVSSS